MVRAWVDLSHALRRAAASAAGVDWHAAVADAAASTTAEHRIAAASAAINLPNVAIESILPPMLGDPDVAVREAALAALMEAIGPARLTRLTWPRVCNALAAAADGIDRHRNRGVAALLVDVWADPVMRAAATESLRAIMADHFHPVHLAARAAIRHLPDERAEVAVRHLTTRPWAAAARARVRAIGPMVVRRIEPRLLMHPSRAAMLGEVGVRGEGASTQRGCHRTVDPWSDSVASRVLARRMLRVQPGGMIEEARRRLRDGDLSAAANAARWARCAGVSRELAPDLCALAERAAVIEGGERVVSAAAVALRDADDAASVDTLRALLRHADGRIVSAAMESLARRAVRAGAWEGVRADVRRALDDPRHRVRATAIVLLGRVEPQPARAALVAMLHDGAAMHRVAALWAAFRLLGGRWLRADPLLWAALCLTSQHDRFSAVRARADVCLSAVPTSV
ncbi:MAG: hypothetical protein KF869_04765 [Phycisphaeraceae bacterium]|nr:hypothetical protein [Phycisphaeraceae bacterium]